MILLVEDNRPFRQALRDAVQTSFPGLQVREAGCLAEADWIVKDQAPQLVLLDLALPDGNGLEWARRIQAEAPDLTLVPCTNHDVLEYREAAQALGLTDFLVKQRLDWGRLHELLADADQSQGRPFAEAADLSSSLRGVSC